MHNSKIQIPGSIGIILIIVTILIRCNSNAVKNEKEITKFIIHLNTTDDLKLNKFDTAGGNYSKEILELLFEDTAKLDFQRNEEIELLGWRLDSLQVQLSINDSVVYTKGLPEKNNNIISLFKVKKSKKYGTLKFVFNSSQTFYYSGLIDYNFILLSKNFNDVFISLRNGRPYNE